MGFGLNAFGSLFAGFIIGFLKRPKEFTKKEPRKRYRNPKNKKNLFWS
jgi:hypothetical protein